MPAPEYDQTILNEAMHPRNFIAWRCTFVSPLVGVRSGG